MFQSAFFKAGYWQADYWQQVGGVTPPTPEPEIRPAGGWVSPPGYERHETAEMRRGERERLGIIPKQQRAIDRAAVKIAAMAPAITAGGLLDAPAVIAAEPFDRLLATLQPDEGMVMALAQAILDRIAWMQAEADEEEAIVRLMMEMD